MYRAPTFLHPDLFLQITAQKKTWLVTGGAGFIGSHLVETLLLAGQKVKVLDNFSTGKKENLKLIEDSVGFEIWKNFELILGDIRDESCCYSATENIDYVLHHAALGSVPLSVKDPQACHDINVGGTLNMLKASRQNNVLRFIYATSAAVYGNSPEMPKHEKMQPNVLSLYAASKMANELYAQSFFHSYGLKCIGLRYFNIFGPRQDPNGSYASVIPSWVDAFRNVKPIHVFGDGQQTRDFCHVSQVVQMNIRAILTENAAVFGDVFNVGLGQSTSLLEILNWIKNDVQHLNPEVFTDPEIIFSAERAGDIKHSVSSIQKVIKEFGYSPNVSVQLGLQDTVSWFLNMKDHK